MSNECACRPVSLPDDFEREKLLEKYRTPSAVREHCNAVAKLALTLAAQMPDITVDTGLLRAACELHDLTRDTGTGHAARAAEILIREGYPEVAALVASHHDLAPDAGVEARLLYLADKLVRGTQNVSLEERFAASEKKCHTPQAMEAWRRRFQDARDVIERYHLGVGELAGLGGNTPQP